MFIGQDNTFINIQHVNTQTGKKHKTIPKSVLTLQAVGVEEILALFVALNSALRTPHPLSGDTPQEALTLVTVGRRGSSPQDEVVGGGGRDGVDQGLEGLLVHVHLLRCRDIMVRF